MNASMRTLLTASIRAGAAMLIVATLAACSVIGGDLAADTIGKGCARSSECGYGEECVLGLCAPSYCSGEVAPCPAPLTCCGNQCIGPDETCQAPCLSDDECNGGICLVTRCLYGCASNDDCPESQTCLALVNVCIPQIQADGDIDLENPGDYEGYDLPFDLPFDIELQQCSVNEDCGDRGRCVAGICLDLGGSDGTGCSSSADCGTGQYCLVSTCVGGACSTDDDCNGGICLPLINQCAGGNPGNQRCSDDGDCETWQQCILGQCLNISTPDGDKDAVSSTDNERSERDRPDRGE